MKFLCVFFDTMRYDHASFNGYNRRTTPVLDELAKESTVFENCYATDVPTQPCYTATLLGRRGIDTGVVTHGHPEETVSPNLDTFPALLARGGVMTAAVSTLYRFRRWFVEGFAHYLQPNLNKWLQQVDCEDVNREAIPWIETHAKEDFFLFLHYWDPHCPYNLAPERYVRSFYSGDPFDPANRSLSDLQSRSLLSYFLSECGIVPELKKGLTDLEYIVAQYDAEISYADDNFGDILDTLKKKKVLEDTTILFTSDHGEALRGEHGIYADHMDAYEQVSHVPLFIWNPGRIKAQRISSFVQHTDIAPTVLEAFGCAIPSNLEGRSLWPILRGEESAHRARVITNHALWCAQRAYRTEHWTLVRTYGPGMLGDVPKWQLFDRTHDRAEAVDVSAENRDVFQELKSQYLEWLDNELGGRPDPVTAEAARDSATRRVRQMFREWQLVKGDTSRAMLQSDRGNIDAAPEAE